MVEEADFNRDFDIVGTLTISSYWKEGETVDSSLGESDEFSGHSFIHYKSDNGTFDNYYSSWAWGDHGAGVYYDRSADLQLASDNATASYTKRITKNQQTKMAREVIDERNDTWSYTNNCSGYANKVFQASTGISFDGYPLTPKKLKDKIQNK